MARAMTALAAADVASARVLPVVVVPDASKAQALRDALVAGGITCAEITLRTPSALDAIRAMAGDASFLVGAGTVLTAAHVDAAVAAGARFIVSPGLSADVVRRCQHHGIAVFPGVATASEVMAALALGLTELKFFPASGYSVSGTRGYLIRLPGDTTWS